MEDIVEVLGALSSEPRLRIIQALKEKPLCVNALARRLEMRQSAISQHLRVLRSAGLVKSEKKGYWVHYSLDGENLGHFRSVLHSLLRVSDERFG